MRTALSTFIFLMVFASATFAAQSVSLNVSDMPIKDAVAQIAQQSGASIVLDPKVTGSVTISLSDADLTKALDVVTKLNKLTWKKLQFAKPNDSTIKLEQLKSAILALSSMPVLGLSVEDPASKTSAVFAKDLPGTPETSSLHLPEGYSWTTVYVILSPEVVADADAGKSDVKTLSEAEVKRTLEMAAMTPQERQQVFASEMNAYMALTPEARQSMMADRMRAMFNMDSQSGQQFREDMRNVMHDLRSSGEMPDFGGRGGRNHGND
ncbi:MAG: hypothetical protein ACYC64_08665 [Armatimonadota bacterium]